uniref:Uncharacterized protein n=1 Tax=Rhizophora mucronata TaxID=61149 RepID=A0A2P2KUM3_RHIMU
MCHWYQCWHRVIYSSKRGGNRCCFLESQTISQGLKIYCCHSLEATLRSTSSDVWV